ncbi:MAG: hypothetical protein IPP71_19070 [Bacteroidetes bacterium]|nr:hypothetical protein [Bacteroidota bacterium]
MFKLNLKGRLCSLLIASLVLTNLTINAQGTEKKAFQDIPESAIELKGERYTFPSNYRILQLNQPELEQLLVQAPEESAYRTSNRLVLKCQCLMEAPRHSAFINR